MALHRDILWIGRQWAVTGHGMQLIDQRLMGAFDIEVARLWDDELIAHMHARQWLNTADFDTGLAVARARHKRPEPSSEEIATPPGPAIEVIAAPQAIEPQAQRHEMPMAEPLSTAMEQAQPAAAQQAPDSHLVAASEPARQKSPDIELKIEGRARFARPWRVWMRGKHE
jgi:hypothetical protein